MKKINFIVPGLFNSGGMKVIYEYAKRLLTYGFDVKIYYPYVYFNLHTGKHDYSLSLKRNYWAWKVFTEMQKYKSELVDLRSITKGVLFLNNSTIRNADYVIATSWPTAHYVNELNSLKGIKYYLIQDYEIWNSNVALVNKSYTLNLKRVTVCNYLSNLLKNKFMVDSVSILNGIDFNVFKPTGRKDYNKKQKTISYIDYELDKKNTIKSIESIEEIKRKFPDIKVKSFGLKKYHRHPDYVTFYENPSINTIAEIYNHTDIFLFTSTEEGFALPPAEAMACKAAVVTSRVGAVPEYSIENETAIYIDPKDTNSIVSSVERLLNDDHFLDKISNSGFEMVKKKLNWDNSVKELIKQLK